VEIALFYEGDANTVTGAPVASARRMAKKLPEGYQLRSLRPVALHRAGHNEVRDSAWWAAFRHHVLFRSCASAAPSSWPPPFRSVVATFLLMYRFAIAQRHVAGGCAEHRHAADNPSRAERSIENESWGSLSQRRGAARSGAAVAPRPHHGRRLSPHRFVEASRGSSSATRPVVSQVAWLLAGSP
jgi:hypothetical protein